MNNVSDPFDVLSQADISHCLLPTALGAGCISASTGATSTSTELKGAVRSEQASATCTSWLEPRLFREALSRLNPKILLKIADELSAQIP